MAQNMTGGDFVGGLPAEEAALLRGSAQVEGSLVWVPPSYAGRLSKVHKQAKRMHLAIDTVVPTDDNLGVDDHLGDAQSHRDLMERFK